MAAYKFMFIILFLTGTCNANLETIEFKLGDRKIRIPITQLAQQSDNGEDMKALVPDQEANPNAYVPVQPAQSPPTLPRYPLPPHNHFPMEHNDSPLSNINYQPPSNNPYARYQPNRYPEEQFSSYYQEQQPPNQYYPPHRHESAHYPHQEEQPQFPSGYNNPYHPPTHNHQVLPVQTQPYASPYLPNYGYPNYLNSRFPEWQQQYQARPYLGQNNNFGNINPNLYKPQTASRKLDSVKSRRIGPVHSPNLPKKMPILPGRNNTQQKPTGLKIKNPKLSAIKTQPSLSRSELIPSNAPKDVPRYIRPMLSEKLMSSDPPPLIPRRKHNLAHRNNLKDKAFNVRPIPTKEDELKLQQMRKQRQRPHSSVPIKPGRNDQLMAFPFQKNSRGVPGMTISDSLIQGPAIDAPKAKPMPVISSNPPIDMQNSNTDVIETAPSPSNPAMLTALEALSLNEDSKINSREILPSSESNIEPVVVEPVSSPQQNEVMDIPLALSPPQETETTVPEISITMPYMIGDTFGQYQPSEPLPQDTTIDNLSETSPAQYLNVNDFVNGPLSDIIGKELLKQNMEAGSPLWSIDTEISAPNSPIDSVLEEITTAIPLPFQPETAEDSLPILTRENFFTTEGSKLQETIDSFVQDTSMYLPIASPSTQDIVTNAPEASPNSRQDTRTDVASLNMATESSSQYITEEPATLTSIKDNNPLYSPNQYTTTSELVNSDTNVSEITETKDTELSVIVSPDENATVMVTARPIEFSTEASQSAKQNTTTVDTKGIGATTHKPRRRRPCKKHHRKRGDGLTGKSGKSGRRRRRRRTTTVRPASTILSAPSTATSQISTSQETNTT